MMNLWHEEWGQHVAQDPRKPKRMVTSRPARSLHDICDPADKTVWDDMKIIRFINKLGLYAVSFIMVIWMVLELIRWVLVTI